jgi:hypothetical protein
LSGTAIQNQTRFATNISDENGFCVNSGWTNTDINTNLCVGIPNIEDPPVSQPTPVFQPIVEPVPVVPPPPPTYRDCISGDLIVGTPPTSYIQVRYSGPVGGTCWEAPTEIGFSPNLREVLKFTYRRGTSTYPPPKTIVVSNTSTAITYRVTVKTNSEIKLSQGGMSGDGEISFVISPRTNLDLVVNVTQQLLTKLVDGNSSFYMDAEYIPVV